MRVTAAIVFLILYEVALLRPALPLVDYYLKYNEYQQRCVNRAKPELLCNGRCVLMQNMRSITSDAQEPKVPAPVKINFEDYPLGFIEIAMLFVDSSMAISQPRQYQILCVVLRGYASDVFHPPLHG